MNTLKEEIQKLADVLTEDCSLKYVKDQKKVKTPDYFSNRHVEERTNRFINYINSSDRLNAVRPYMIWLKVYTEHRAVVRLDRRCPINLDGVYEDNNEKRIEINI